MTRRYASFFPALMALASVPFEVASVKLDKGDFRPPTFALSNNDFYRPVGGRFFADFALPVYISRGTARAAWAEITADQSPAADPRRRSYRAPFGELN